MTTIQPAMTLFLNKKGTSVMLASESTYNWETDEDPWQVPVTLALSQIQPPFGMEFIGVGVGGSYYVEKADYAQEWDFRATISVVFP